MNDTGYLHKPSESRARLTTSRTPPIMSFKQIPRKPVGADLSRTPPIYRPLPAVPLSRFIC